MQLKPSMTELPVPAQHRWSERWDQPRLFAVLFVVEWLLLAIEPSYRRDWGLENVLTLAVGCWLLRGYRRRPLSDTSYALLWIFGSVHVVGAHYTYAEVPYDEWFKALLGTSLNSLFGATRNHFDRLVHFMFGLLCYKPMSEVLFRDIPDRMRMRRRMLTVSVLVAISTLYELLEWAAAALFGGELGQAYLGTQGDVWDAHKDMAMALAGACLAAGLSWSLQTRGQRH